MNAITTCKSKLRTPATRFNPHTRGDIAASLISEKSLHALSPESPRSVEMLEGIRVVGDDTLTAADSALYELLVSHAYAADEELKREAHSLPSFAARDFLGGVRRSQLEGSLDRLRRTVVEFDLTDEQKVRSWGKVPLLVSWLSSANNSEPDDIIHFNLPLPIRVMMSAPLRYRYIELAAIAQMKSKYGIRLYRRLLVPAGSGLDNLLTFEVTPEEVAGWLGYRPEAKWHYGQFKLRALDPALADIAHSRKFSVGVEEIRARKPGAPVTMLKFAITLKARSFFTVSTAPVEQGFMPLYRYADHADLQVSPKIWLRARTVFKISDHDAAQFAKAWLVAVDEAVKAPDREVYGREFRGVKLLAACKNAGADQTAWSFIEEEIRQPDLTTTEKRREVVRQQVSMEIDRLERSKMSNLPIANIAASMKKPPTIASISTKAGPNIQAVAKALLDKARGIGGARVPLSDLSADINAVVAGTEVDARYENRISALLSVVPWRWQQEDIAEQALTIMAGERINASVFLADLVDAEETISSRAA